MSDQNKNQLAIFLDGATNELKQYLIAQNDVTAYDYNGKVLVVYQPALDFKKMLELSPKATVELGFLLQSSNEGMIDPDLTRLLRTYKKIPDDTPISIEALIDMVNFVERYRDTLSAYQQIADKKQIKLRAEQQQKAQADIQAKIDQARKTVEQAEKIDKGEMPPHDETSIAGNQPSDDQVEQEPASGEKEPADDSPVLPNDDKTGEQTVSEKDVPVIHEPDFTYGNQDPLMMIATKLFVQSNHKQLPHFSEEMQNLLGDQLVNTETALQEAESNTISMIYQALQHLDYDKLIDLENLIADYNKVVEEQKNLLARYAAKVKEQKRQDQIKADAIARKATDKELNEIKAKQRELEAEKNQLESELQTQKQKADTLNQQLSQKTQELTSTKQNLQESKQTIQALSINAVQQEAQQNQMAQQQPMQAPSLNFDPAKKSNANKGVMAVGAVVAVLLVILIVVLLIK